MAKKNRARVEEAGGVLEISARSKKTGEEVDTAVMQDAGVAFDLAQMHLDLTKDEKRRTTALVLAIQAYDHLIIKDAEYLREASSQARSNGSVIRPATMDAMVIAALQFDAFISGRMPPRSGISRESQPEAGADDPRADAAVDPAGEASAVDPAPRDV